VKEVTELEKRCFGEFLREKGRQRFGTDYGRP
jgi:hypothetical protein